MSNTCIQFQVVSNKSGIIGIERNVIEHPVIKFDHSKGDTKWFDDSRLLKNKNN